MGIITAIKKQKEVLLYLVFGGLTTIISIGAFSLLYAATGINALAANVLAWIAAVLFAYITNRIWVFEAKTSGWKELMLQLGSFTAGRLATLLMEELIIFIFITGLQAPAIPVKTAAQILVIAANYVFSKCLVFKKQPDKDRRDYGNQ